MCDLRYYIDITEIALNQPKLGYMAMTKLAN